MNHTLDGHAKSWFFALGVGLMLLGGLAIYCAAVTTLVSVIVLGWMLIVMGIFEVAQAITTRAQYSFFEHIILGMLSIVGGGIILMHPLMTEIQLTLFLSFMFIVGGIFKTVFAFTHHAVNRGWRILDGMVTFTLGIMVLQKWPESGLLVIGLFVGINMFMTGLNWVARSFVGNRLT